MLNDRIENLLQLKEYILSDNSQWQEVKIQAERMNGWFTQNFIEYACDQIAHVFLDESNLRNFSEQIITSEIKAKQLVIGITMAGNIPLVGFHDFLCVYLSGNPQRIKLSSKDNVLLTHLIHKLCEFNAANIQLISISEMLKGCDVYIATGSNSSARYFEQYFAKFPHIIRRNRTSIAILTGNETAIELENLADDVYTYFGLGCRNVTKLYVPKGYNFEPLLNAFRKYDDLKNHNKFRNNLDYNLAIYILNNAYYMSNESILLVENSAIFSPVSVLHYEFYEDINAIDLTSNKDDIQAIIGTNYLAFGSSQSPSLLDFADGVDVIKFLNSL